MKDVSFRVIEILGNVSCIVKNIVICSLIICSLGGENIKKYKGCLDIIDLKDNDIVISQPKEMGVRGYDFLNLNLKNIYEHIFV